MDNPPAPFAVAAPRLKMHSAVFMMQAALDPIARLWREMHP